MIAITDTIAIDEDEIDLSFIRAGGPGGQNVNKVSSAVQLRFDARHSPSLPQGVRRRVETVAGSRMTKDGVIVITANRHRTQEANRRDAIDRLVALLQAATHRPKPRIATRPSRASQKKRLDRKAKQSRLKRLRTRKITTDD